MVRLGQAALLVVAAAVCAVLSNLAAGPSRRLAWIGEYPAALTVPEAPLGPTPAPAALPAASAAAAAPSAPVKDYPAHPDRPWITITGEEAADLHSRGIPFLDARRTSVYTEGHIAGARSFPAALVFFCWRSVFLQEFDVGVEDCAFDTVAPGLPGLADSGFHGGSQCL